MKITQVRIHSHGGPEVLKAESVDLTDPGSGEAQIRQNAMGLNFQDVYHRSGQYPLTMPSGIGTEAAGVVVKVGTAVAGVAVGDRVCYAGGAPGAYADHRNLPAARADRRSSCLDGRFDSNAHVGDRH